MIFFFIFFSSGCYALEFQLILFRHPILKGSNCDRNAIKGKKIPYLRFKTLKCHTLWGSTYLSSPYMGLHTLCSVPTRLFVDNYIFIQQNAALSSTHCYIVRHSLNNKFFTIYVKLCAVLAA